MSIGERLKHIREQRKLTQQQLADGAGITKSLVCQMERGSKAMSLPVAVEVAAVLECTVNDFLTDNPTLQP